MFYYILFSANFLANERLCLPNLSQAGFFPPSVEISPYISHTSQGYIATIWQIKYRHREMRHQELEERVKPGGKWGDVGQGLQIIKRIFRAIYLS